VTGLCGGERTVDRSTAMSHQVSRNRESGGCVLIDIANRETPMESMVEGMWRGRMRQELSSGGSRVKGAHHKSRIGEVRSSRQQEL
jgi:hypothetical protein